VAPLLAKQWPHALGETHGGFKGSASPKVAPCSWRATLAVIAAAVTFCTWPVFAWHRRHPAAAGQFSEVGSGGSLAWARGVVCPREPRRPSRARRALRGCRPRAVAACRGCHDSAGTNATSSDPRPKPTERHPLKSSRGRLKGAQGRYSCNPRWLRARPMRSPPPARSVMGGPRPSALVFTARWCGETSGLRRVAGARGRARSRRLRRSSRRDLTPVDHHLEDTLADAPVAANLCPADLAGANRGGCCDEGRVADTFAAGCPAALRGWNLLGDGQCGDFVGGALVCPASRPANPGKPGRS
jgi:hypothetical protein